MSCNRELFPVKNLSYNRSVLRQTMNGRTFSRTTQAKGRGLTHMFLSCSQKLPSQILDLKFNGSNGVRSFPALAATLSF